MSFIDQLLARKPTKPPQIRKEVRPAKGNPAGPKPSQSAPPRSSLSQPSHPKPRSHVPSPASRANSSKSATRLKPPPPKVGAKRKSTLPVFGSDSEGDSDSLSGSVTPLKRTRIDSATPLDPERRIRDLAHWEEGKDDALSFIHSKDLCSGEYAHLYKHQFDVPQGDFVEAHLRYPGSVATETFRILNLKNSRSEDYDPISDLISTIITTLTHYLPASASETLIGDKLQGTGLEYDLEQAVKFTDPSIFLRHIQRYNEAIDKARDSGTIARQIDTWTRVDPPLVKRIIDQIYARTVSPKADKVGKIKNADRSNTYGELLPDFATQIFKETNLTSGMVFLDLGSGVGNIVIQAALEVGCASYGIEMMPTSCELAAAQAAELPARARLWGLNCGEVKLYDGDFRSHPDIPALLKRVDVVLVNNEVFSAELNSNLKNMWLDLKQGAKVVSLKSFVPEGWKLTERTEYDPMATFEVISREYWSSWVSWKDGGGEYFIATKDESRYNRLRAEFADKGRSTRGQR